MPTKKAPPTNPTTAPVHDSDSNLVNAATPRAELDLVALLTALAPLVPYVAPTVELVRKLKTQPVVYNKLVTTLKQTLGAQATPLVTWLEAVRRAG